ncbi:MAG: four helix bundle protein [Candidatus Saccharimonadales bacterium]
MAIQSFRDLVVWQKAHHNTVLIYKTFAELRDFSFRDQIQRASVSVMNNIAEGYARRSDKAFYHFLCIAKGSNTEVESMIILARSLGYVSGAQYSTLTANNNEVGKLLSGFLKKLSANS